MFNKRQRKTRRVNVLKRSCTRADELRAEALRRVMGGAGIGGKTNVDGNYTNTKGTKPGGGH